jgi:tetratricopeptide (TPR) repeat protein
MKHLFLLTLYMFAALGNSLGQNTLENLAERVNQHYANADIDSALYYAQIITGNLCYQTQNTQVPCALWKNNLADLLTESQQLEKAQALYLEAAQTLSQHQEHYADYALVLNNLGTLYRQMEKTDSSAYYYKSALATLPDTHANTEYRMEVQTNYAELLLAQQQPEEAVLLLQSALHTAEKIPQVHDTYLAQLHRNLGRAFELMQKNEEATYHFNHAKKLTR